MPIAGKLEGKTALQQQAGLEVQNDAPVLHHQTLSSGAGALPGILDAAARSCCWARAIAELEGGIKAVAGNPQSVVVTIGYDEQLSPLIAGSDVILVPSRFEAGRLTQLYGRNDGTYFTPAKGRRTGRRGRGLLTRKLDEALATSLVFDMFDAAGIGPTIHRAFALYKRRSDCKLIKRRGTLQQCGRDTPAAQYRVLMPANRHLNNAEPMFRHMHHLTILNGSLQ